MMIGISAVRGDHGPVKGTQRSHDEIQNNYTAARNLKPGLLDMKQDSNHGVWSVFVKIMVNKMSRIFVEL
jgi:hypothetical protein